MREALKQSIISDSSLVQILLRIRSILNLHGHKCSFPVLSNNIWLMKVGSIVHFKLLKVNSLTAEFVCYRNNKKYFQSFYSVDSLDKMCPKEIAISLLLGVK